MSNWGQVCVFSCIKRQSHNIGLVPTRHVKRSGGGDASLYQQPCEKAAHESERGGYQDDDAEAADERLFDGAFDCLFRLVVQLVRDVYHGEAARLRFERGASLRGKV